MIEIAIALVVLSIIDLVVASWLIIMMASTGRVISRMKRRTAFLLFFAPPILVLILAIVGVSTFGSASAWIVTLISLGLLCVNVFVQMCCSVPVMEEGEKRRKERDKRVSNAISS